MKTLVIGDPHFKTSNIQEIDVEKTDNIATLYI